MKKRIICLLFALVLSVSVLAACAEEPEEDNSRLAGLFVMETDKSEYSYHDEIKITIYNNSGYERSVDNLYTLYRLENGAYKKVEGGVFKEEERSFTCEVGGETNMSIRLKSVHEEELEPGTYLIEKTLGNAQDGEPHSEYTVYAAFDIVESE